MSESKEMTIFEGANVPAELRKKIEQASLETLDEMRENVEPKAHKIRIAAGGINKYVVGSDEETMDEIRCVVITASIANAYWHRMDDTANPILLEGLDEGRLEKVPICSSFGKIGSRERQIITVDGGEVPCFGECGTRKNPKCWLNTFGTAVNDQGKRTKGVACKNGRRLLLFIEGRSIPYVLTLPPMSVVPFDDYTDNLRSKGRPYWHWMHTLRLEKKFNKDNQPYSIFKPGAPEKLPDDVIVAMYEFREKYSELVKVDITADEFTGGSENENDEDLPF